MTQPATLLAIITIVIAVLLSSGALAWFLRSSTRLVVLERTSAEHEDIIKHINAQVIQDSARIALMENNTKGIEVQLVKLSKIDTIDAKLDLFYQQLKDSVPRHEFESRWMSNEKRFDGLASSLSTLQETLNEILARQANK